jgi:branched-chain amino acid transport system substrate-binding protein
MQAQLTSGANLSILVPAPGSDSVAPVRKLTLGFVLVVALATGLVPTGEVEAQQPRLTVYSSLPLQGASRPQTLAVVRGARLALSQRGYEAGGHRIRYVSLDDSTARSGSWTPQAASRNARRAGSDASTIAYIGEFNSAATVISLPILNHAGIAQISPSSTATGLTRDLQGAAPGEPDKYYPSAVRTFVRIAANDTVQGGALAVAMQQRGCSRVAAFHDGELYGRGVGHWVRLWSRQLGMRIVLARRIRPSAAHYRPQARAVRRARADCTVFTGITANNAVQLFNDLGRAVPRAKLFGSDGVADSGFTDPREGGITRRVARRVFLSMVTLAPSALPAAGQAVLAQYRKRYGDRFPDPYALHGYEAMQLVLDAVAVAGASRDGVIDSLFSVRDRQSVLGTYSIDAFGDTTLRSFGIYRILRGRLRWSNAVAAP